MIVSIPDLCTLTYLYCMLEIIGYFLYLSEYTNKNSKEKSASRIPEQTSAKDEDYISIIIGALAALIVILTIIVVFVIVRHKRRQNTNRNNLKPAADNVLAINLNNFHGTSNGKVSNGNVYNGVATEEEHVKELNGKVLNLKSNCAITCTSHSTDEIIHV